MIIWPDSLQWVTLKNGSTLIHDEDDELRISSGVQSFSIDDFQLWEWDINSFGEVFESFIGIENPEDLLSFVNYYGVIMYTTFGNKFTFTDNFLVTPLIEQARLLQFLTDILAYIASNDKKALKTIIKYKLRSVEYLYKGSWRKVPNIGHTFDISSQNISFSKAAFNILYSEIDNNLKNSIDVRLDPFGNSFMPSYFPKDTQSTMWLYFAYSLDEGSSYRFCDMCGKKYRIDNKPGRMKQVCSDACRVRKYRRKSRERSS